MNTIVHKSICKSSLCFAGGDGPDSEPDHDGGHGSEGDGNWDGD